MRVKCYDEFGAGNSIPVFDAFMAGVRASGGDIVRDYSAADCVVIWSILFSGRMAPAKQVWEQALQDDKPVIVLEIGALKRGETWKVGIDGINRDATWVKPYQENRAEKLGIKLKPWKDDGEFITICTQRSDSTQWPTDITVEQWVRQQIDYCFEMEFNRPIVIRPHPRDKITDWGFLVEYKEKSIFFDQPQLITGSYDSFNHNETFDRSWMVINHSSGPGVQAALDGINVLCSPSSLAWDVAFDKGHQLDRTEWLDMLVHTEWTIDEIREGHPWNHLKSYL